MNKIIKDIVNAMFAVEVVQEYLDMGKTKQAQKHLSALKRQLLDIATECDEKRISDIEWDKKLKQSRTP